ncbi:MAG TPA: LPS export ABC transporter ATP-binding protein [Acidobacteriota bacterium]|nr:LPS export ABC transporter ATP-binding protein [Acidobacteriota bacterium]
MEYTRLQASGLCKSYKGRKVVGDVNLEVARGEVVGLLGPNGAGKTTTFYLIVGLISPEKGEVRLGEQEIQSLPMYQRARMGISYLPQEPSVFRKLTVLDNLRCVAETLNVSPDEREEITERMLDEFGIAHLSNQGAYALSGGERRRLEIARALVLTPQFILLDEPFAGIDPLAVLDIQKIIERLRARNIGILITDHNVRDTLNITDRAYIINNGKILREGTPEQLASDSEVKKVYLGEHFKLS